MTSPSRPKPVRQEPIASATQAPTQLPEDILSLLKDTKRERLSADDSKYEMLEAYLRGEHYQDGEGWIGPKVTTELLTDELQRGFVADGLIRQAVQRYSLAVVGRSPEFRFELRQKPKRTITEDEIGNKKLEIEDPAPADQVVIDEVESALTEMWMDRPELRRTVITAAQRAALHNLSLGRVYVAAEEDIEVNSESLADMLNVFDVHCPGNHEAEVLRNVHGRIRACLYRTGDGYIISWIDKSGRTVIAETDSNWTILDSESYDLGRRLPIADVRDVGIIFPNVITQQKMVDYDTTMLRFNNMTGAFRQQLMFNAQEPVVERLNKETGEMEEVPAPLDQGIGVVNWVVGVPVDDAMTGDTKGYATPSVVWKDPIAQEGLINSITHNVRRFFENVYQAHILISGDATASGTSRQQAVQDHIMSLEQLQQEMEAFIRWMLELMLKWAAEMMGDPTRYDAFKVVVTCRVSAVQPTPEERSALVAEYNAGLRSRETTMALLGITDVDAEIARIDAETSKDMANQAAFLPGEDPAQDAEGNDEKPPTPQEGAGLKSNNPFVRK